MKDIELVQRVVEEALRTQTDITPDDRMEWAYFAKAMKTLGFDESDFVRLSAFHGTPQRASSQKWKSEKPLQSKDGAIKKILHFAKCAGMDIKAISEGDSPLSVKPRRTTSATIPKPKPPRKHVKMDFLINHCEGAIRTNLFNFLLASFSFDEIAKAFDAYLVGETNEFGETSKGYFPGCAFPYINRDGECVDVKLMAYDEEGHRKKEGYCFNWLLAKHKLSEYRDKWPVFGEHLLKKRPTARVAVVESEKSALIASIAYPQFIWVAVGSLNNLNKDRLKALKNREIYLFPDADGVGIWEEKKIELARNGFAVDSRGEWIAEHAKNPKDDIADIILNRDNEPSEDKTAIVVYMP